MPRPSCNARCGNDSGWGTEVEGNWDVRRVTVEGVRPLRRRVLRPGLPAHAACFDGDDNRTAIHLAAFDRERSMVGVLSLLPAAPLGTRPVFQLRGMAVDAATRRRGVGRALLNAINDHLPADALVWCNARVEAASIYRRDGWVEDSGVFDIPGVGEHIRLRRPDSPRGTPD